MASTIRREDVAALIRHINSNLIVRQLQSVLKNTGQPTSGLKIFLQRRLATYIEAIAAKNDTQAFEKVQMLVNSGESAHGHLHGVSHTLEDGSTPSQPVTTTTSSPSSPNPTLRLHFKESPFYTILSPFCEVVQCPAMISHRHTVKTVVTLSAAQVQQLNSDESYRCMVYCATLDPLTSFTRETDVAFPHQVEIRVNDIAVPGLNLRGLKNKPGSTRPADITDSLIRKANYRNEVGLLYALTEKEFGFLVNLVKVHTVESLVQRLRVGDSIAKDTVISDLVKKNEDTDLEATSATMSLKCPLSTLRIELPVRSKYCTHSDCFDATSFLQLQQQAPTWTCPTCMKSVSFKQLVVDRYFYDILNSTPKSVESVTIDAEGKWSVAVEASSSPMPESSDDEYGGKITVDVRDNQYPKAASSEILHPVTPTTTSGRESSISSARVGNTSHKRPISHIIDLTLSDDDEPSRPTKRVNIISTPSSMNGFHDGDRLTPNGFERSPVGTPGPHCWPRR
ncbi:PINIT domain-containing protein [Geopyxis carbonaria]|nr:PINIT domain-containing protein [Geopyxis carbonaria]